ncbi:hypothetical protein [Vandammella animalimorsus]|uniref:hypothetical protein n=1 Tax=Vandammella animalimorsus TaxID=2029117 RepID=UPI001553C5A3|nr:hypothetical protein [Vandammella animalimorsus]
MPRSLALRALMLRSAWGGANYVLAPYRNAAPGGQIAGDFSATASESVGKITQL